MYINGRYYGPYFDVNAFLRNIKPDFLHPKVFLIQDESQMLHDKGRFVVI
jgi:hypothetical protein